MRGLSLLMGALCPFGCATTSPIEAHHEHFIEPRTFPVFDGTTGAPISWEVILARIDGADVIILGEQHDDAAGHRVQQAIVEDVLRATRDIAVSMEMLDRSEQPIVDDYVAGLIERDEFIEEIASTRWLRDSRAFLAGDINRAEFEKRITRLGWPDWEVNYQPMIDAVRQAHRKNYGARVIAANAPWMRYTSLITLDDGYVKLESLTPAQRALVAWPDDIPRGKYRERFWEVMAGRKEGEPPKEAAAHDPADPHSGSFTDEQMLAGFMKQLLYDATMADSIARALDAGLNKVIHLVGQFHSDFEGGTVIELRRRAPQARILTVSLIPEPSSSLRDEDRGRADVVIYTK